jgi:hypothetical protein
VDADRRCEQLASAQHGVLSREQALACGIRKGGLHRRTRAGRWRLVLPGVYGLPGAPPGWHRELMTACLWANGAASHRAAAALWALDGFDPGVVEVTTARRVRNPAAPLVIHRSLVAEVDIDRRLSIPVTTPARTLVDLGAVVGPDAVEAALDDALRSRLTSLPRLRWTLERCGGSGRRGAGVLRALLTRRTLGEIAPESPLERRTISLLEAAGLPPPARQHVIRERGRVVARVDVAYLEARLAIEVDGYRWHSGHAAWQRDLARRNALASRGWRVLHVTARSLDARPCDVVAEVERARAILSR